MTGYQYGAKRQQNLAPAELPVPLPTGLSESDRELLMFEAAWQVGNGVDKRSGIRQRFGISASTYYDRLDRIIETEAAMRIAPSTVRRRRAVRAGRRRNQVA